MLVDFKFDYLLHVVDLKLSLEAHKSRPSSHNAAHSYSTNIQIPQAYSRAIKTIECKNSNAEHAIWRYYSKLSIRCFAPTRTRKSRDGVSRVSAKAQNFKVNSDFQSLNIRTHGWKQLNHMKEKPNGLEAGHE